MDRSSFIRIGGKLVNRGAIVAVKVEYAPLEGGQVKELSGIDGDFALYSGASRALSVTVWLANGENFSCFERRVNVEPLRFTTDKFRRLSGPPAMITQAIIMESRKLADEWMVPVVANHEKEFFNYLDYCDEIPAAYPEQAPA